MPMGVRASSTSRASAWTRSSGLDDHHHNLDKPGFIGRFSSTLGVPASTSPPSCVGREARRLKYVACADRDQTAETRPAFCARQGARALLLDGRRQRHAKVFERAIAAAPLQIQVTR
jgi:hypothetical protein